jgi:hypothetical protein
MAHKDMGIHLNFLDLSLAVVVDGTTWTPDVADDMTGRMKVLFEESIQTLVDYNLLPNPNEELEEKSSIVFTQEEEEEEPGDRPSKELIDPNVIFLMEKEFGEGNG